MSVLGLPLVVFIACVVIVFLGAIVQGTLGIGLGMVAAPMLALADRRFIPVVILVAILPLTVSMTLRERSLIDRRGVILAVIGRIPGVALGAAAVALAGDRVLSVLVAVTVLGAVVASLLVDRGRQRPTTAPMLVTAGLASGFMGTSTGIGGPPMALTYQHADPAIMRSTISLFFTIGSILSIIGLAVSGSIGGRQIGMGLALVPAVMAGFVVSRLFITRLAGERFRIPVLTVCALAAVALLVEEFT